MQQQISSQAAALILALALGVGTGLAYDLLRPPRWQLNRLAPLLDGAFAFFAGLSLFFYAMAADGRLGLWELCCSLLGFLLYLNLFSPHVLRKISLFYRIFGNIFLNIRELLKKFHVSAKKLFQKTKKCFIVKK